MEGKKKKGTVHKSAVVLMPGMVFSRTSANVFFLTRVTVFFLTSWEVLFSKGGRCGKAGFFQIFLYYF